MIETKNIVKKFAAHLALNEVSISVRKGSVFGLLGPNGAGKTTLIRIINRISAPDSGEVFFEGKPLQASDVYRIGYLPEERGLYKKMKVGEQALYLARLKGLSRRDAMNRLKIWFEKFEIAGWWNKKVEELSKGMAQKVQFIVTVIHEPELLIFDEPFSGFDPVNTLLLKNEILSLRDKGSTVIFSTHNMASVEELCDDIVLIDKAQCMLAGKVNEIRRSYSRNLYEIKYRGDTNAILKTLESNGYEVNVGETTFGVSNIRVKASGEHDNNRLLSLAMPVVEITGFTEVMPTMNDIFISVIQSN
ncbi:MAG: ATP-binding cassette domain-containing protein [Prevotellaceae bacterium]|jgi:ABC-2 type transport system ATP-binding protein|nr:ATP-binding cassette domain-containing protein [Prevotellaceae bacterium]